MNNLHIGQQQAVTDPLQRERLRRALRIILDPPEKTNAGNPLCQGCNASSTVASTPQADPYPSAELPPRLPAHANSARFAYGARQHPQCLPLVKLPPLSYSMILLIGNSMIPRAPAS
jgi:hypothetical protein